MLFGGSADKGEKMIGEQEMAQMVDTKMAFNSVAIHIVFVDPYSGSIDELDLTLSWNHQAASERKY